MCPARKFCLDQKPCPKRKNNHPRRQDDKYSFVKNPQLRKHRRQFAMFLKILLRRLENDPKEAFVLQNVKNVIQYHSWKLKGQRERDEDASSNSSSETSSSSSSGSTRNICLEVESMEAPIRSFVGEMHWISAHITMRQIQLRSQSNKTST